MKVNQNLLIAQVVNTMNAGGYFVWRQENNGRINEKKAVDSLSKLLFGLTHVDYNIDKVRLLVQGILRKSYSPVPSSIRGVSDVIGWNLATGVWVAVEIKIGADKLFEDQTIFSNRLKVSGGEFFLVRDIVSFRSFFAAHILKKKS